MSHQEKQLSLKPEDRVKFILAGNAELKAVSKKTGMEAMYKILWPKKGKRVLWVMAKAMDLIKGDAFVYIGYIIVDNKTIPGSKPFFWGGNQKASLPKGDYRVRGFEWLWYKLFHGEDISEHLDLYHTGKCGRCGRKLLDPVSISTGLGPVCRVKAGN